MMVLVCVGTQPLLSLPAHSLLTPLSRVWSHRYYCPPNSITPTQWQCGSVAVHCPSGSGAPVTANLGEYTVGPSAKTQNGTRPCPSGSYCLGGVAQPCPAGRFGCADRLGTAECNSQCSAGFHCPSGSSSSQACVHFGEGVVCVCVLV
jgi:hypothetical protein